MFVTVLGEVGEPLAAITWRVPSEYASLPTQDVLDRPPLRASESQTLRDKDGVLALASQPVGDVDIVDSLGGHAQAFHPW